MSGKSAIIFGATGQAGQRVLKELLASSHFTRIGEYGRHVTDPNTLTIGKEKLEQKVVDFENLEEAGIKDGKWDAVFITLGTSKKNAGSAEAFVRIDREYVLKAAGEAKTTIPGHEQRLLYCSSNAAKYNSWLLYPQSKALTEQGLASLGYADTIVFRPGYIAETTRPEHRLIETIVDPIFTGLQKISSNMKIPVSVLGKSMVLAGELGSSGLPPSVNAKKMSWEEGAPQFTTIDNAGALELVKSK